MGFPAFALYSGLLAHNVSVWADASHVGETKETTCTEGTPID